MPKVTVPRQWTIVYYNGSKAVNDDQLAEVIGKDIKVIHEIQMNLPFTRWEKSDIPEFQMKSNYDNIFQLYVDNDIHLTSVDHAKDVIKDNRFWVVEKWLNNVNLSHYDVDAFIKVMDTYLKGRDTHNV
jgi:hypothetical protein